jgi:hypothetical protein
MIETQDNKEVDTIKMVEEIGMIEETEEIEETLMKEVIIGEMIEMSFHHQMGIVTEIEINQVIFKLYLR